jgi:hypothetical protein
LGDVPNSFSLTTLGTRVRNITSRLTLGRLGWWWGVPFVAGAIAAFTVTQVTAGTPAEPTTQPPAVAKPHVPRLVKLPVAKVPATLPPATTTTTAAPPPPPAPLTSLEVDAANVRNADGALANDVAAVNGILGQLPGVLSPMQQNTNGAAQWQQTTATDASKHAGATCNDSATATTFFNAVVGGEQTISALAGQGAGRLQALRNDLANTQSALATYQSALNGAPAGSGPDPSGVSSDINAAGGLVSSALAQINAAIDQANNDVTSSYASANQANQQGSCNAAPATPTLLAHIN